MRVDAIRIRDNILGKEFDTNNCGKCFVIDYKGCRKVTVMFYNPIFAVNCTLQNLKNGEVDNPFFPNMYGKGFFGVGKHKFVRDKAYSSWRDMLRRCYSDEVIVKNLAYKDVKVCDEWLNFQNYAEWFYSQTFSEAKDDNDKFYQLDKDILLKGNKIYSPDTCCFVPADLNRLFTSSKKSRGNLPIGVSFDKSTNKFRVDVNKHGKQTYVGRFDTPEKAFQAYKEAKEYHVKDVASLWRGKIDERVYKTLLNWCVDVSD